MSLLSYVMGMAKWGEVTEAKNLISLSPNSHNDESGISVKKI